MVKGLEVMNLKSLPKDDFRVGKLYPVSISEDKGVSPLYQRLHWHDVLELNLIKSGSGYYMINGHKIEFGQGDIFLINSNDLHRAYEIDDLVLLVISFDPSWFSMDQLYDSQILSPFKEMGVYYANRLDRTNKIMPYLREILLDIEQEDRQREASYVSAIRSQLLRFLAYVGRNFREYRNVSGNSQRGVNSGYLEKIRAFLPMLEEQYGQQWTIQAMADAVYLSPSRFSTIFKQVVGVSPIEYLIQIRLSHAVSLIEDTDMKIVDIANCCGFCNLSNFNRLFKNMTGMSPKQIRKKPMNK